jgi:hypothetical protein
MTGGLVTVIIVWSALGGYYLVQGSLKCIFMAGQRVIRGKQVPLHLCAPLEHDTTAQLDELGSHTDKV